MSRLIASAFQNGGTVSKNNRKRYVHQVPVETLNAIEALCLDRIAARANPPDEIDPDQPSG